MCVLSTHMHNDYVCVCVLNTHSMRCSDLGDGLTYQCLREKNQKILIYQNKSARMADPHHPHYPSMDSKAQPFPVEAIYYSSQLPDPSRQLPYKEYEKFFVRELSGRI